MRVLLDPSVLVAALVRSHPRHVESQPWLARVLAGEHELVLATHTLAELHAVLTTLPVRPRISPKTAQRLREDNLPPGTELVALDITDYREVLRRVVDLSLSGEVI